MAVCVKAVPLDGTDGAVDLDPVNEVSVEWALRQREAGHCGDVVAVTMGPAGASDALRRALAMGCDHALHVVDPALAGACVGTTADVLAAAVRHADASLAVFGYESLDGSSGAVPSAVAATLGWPLLSFARDAWFDGRLLQAERDMGRGPEVVRAELPAVVTFAAGNVEPRYPTLRAVIAARTAAIATIELTGLGIAQVRTGGERVVAMRPVATRPRTTRVVVADEGPDEILRLLDERALLDA